MKKLNTYGIEYDADSLEALVTALKGRKGTPLHIEAAYDPATGKFVWDEMLENSYAQWDEGMISLGGAQPSNRQHILTNLARELGIIPFPGLFEPWYAVEEQ